MKTLLAVNELYFRYSTNDRLLEGVNLELHEGEILGIIGPNGGGKSTLLKLIVGQLKPQRGSVDLLGKRSFSYLPQNQELNEILPISVSDLIELGAYGVDKKSLRLSVEEALSLVGLEQKKHAFVKNLSGGERQRALIAKALIKRPDILIMDEPSKGLDKKSMDQLFALLKEIANKTKTGIILVDHHISQVTKISSKILCLGHNSHWHDQSEFLNKQVLENIYDCELELALLHEHEECH